MFTSLRSRLWLSYAFVISVALSIVAIVLLVYIARNPVLSRQTQQQLRAVRDLIVENPQRVINDQDSLADFSRENDVRVLVFNSAREMLFDSNLVQPALPFPRRNLLNQESQIALDVNGDAWLYAASRMAGGRVLVVAAPRPRVPVLTIFADHFFRPSMQGGLIALLISLVLAFLLSRWVADPLQKVVSVARNYPSDAIQPVPTRGPREVQDLTRAFNSMISRVDSSQKSQKDFVADVSHELKTPLTSIQGFAQAILDDTANTPESRKQAAQIIYDESGRMHRMALDLLDLARLESGIADLEMSEVDVETLLQNIVEKFTPQAKRANVELKLNIPAGLPMVVGDGDRLAQVFTNLVDNALKFTSEGGGVTLSVKEVGSEMELSIADTGSGVPKEALPRLFDRFYQVDQSRAGGEKHGTGLGLAIAKEIVQAHGGRIGVRSQAGQGTVFVIHLPLDTA
jgi:signal transduction histidine kinase